VLIRIEYRSVQLARLPMPPDVQADVSSAHSALIDLSVHTIQGGARAYLARRYLASRRRREHGSQRAEARDSSTSGGSDSGSDRSKSGKSGSDGGSSSGDDSDSDTSSGDSGGSTTSVSSDATDAEPVRPPPGAHCCGIDLSVNQLSDLDASVLTQLPYLCSLDASLNHLARLHSLNTKPLQTLRWLNLSNSQLTAIAGVLSQPSLIELNLSYNALVGVEGIGALAKLRVLQLEGNQLQSLEGIGALPRLQSLVAHHNESLASLDGVRGACSLARLDVSSCNLGSLKRVLELCAELPRLRELALHDNLQLPEDEYTPRVICEIAKLRALDEMPITARVRVHAKRLMAGRMADDLVDAAHGLMQLR
jgi:hypothetical protein